MQKKTTFQDQLTTKDQSHSHLQTESHTPVKT